MKIFIVHNFCVNSNKNPIENRNPKKLRNNDYRLEFESYRIESEEC